MEILSFCNESLVEPLRIFLISRNRIIRRMKTPSLFSIRSYESLPESDRCSLFPSYHWNHILTYFGENVHYSTGNYTYSSYGKVMAMGNWHRWSTFRIQSPGIQNKQCPAILLVTHLMQCKGTGRFLRFSGKKNKEFPSGSIRGGKDLQRPWCHAGCGEPPSCSRILTEFRLWA